MAAESILRWPTQCACRRDRAINVFFYDGPISRAIAFEDLLADGKRFSDRLLGAFSDARTWPQLVHIATDGETYGHHRAYGDMALAFALHNIETSQVARLTNYAEYLEKHPPTQEAKIIGTLRGVAPMDSNTMSQQRIAHGQHPDPGVGGGDGAGGRCVDRRRRGARGRRHRTARRPQRDPAYRAHLARVLVRRALEAAAG